MKLSDKGAEFIANFEGFRAEPYWDVDHWSSGHGTRAGKHDRPISKAEARRRLRHQSDQTYGKAVDGLGADLNQNQFDALTSFAFNLGPGAVARDSRVGMLVRSKQYREAADALLDYDKAGGKRLAGLTRRRQQERALFLKKPPVDYSDDERHLLHVLKDKGASKTRRERAAKTLRAQAEKIQTIARREKDWAKHDRGRRYKGIRRALRRYA